MQAPDQDLPIQQVGKYEVVREIGKGGMGTVYLGFDRYQNRDVAIKVASTIGVRDESYIQKFQKMFFNESRIAGMLRHPNIVKLFDAGADGPYYYIAMEYVQGSRTLKDHCTIDSLLPVEQVVEIIFKCAKALDYAHRQGVIHRDIKPGNILITEQYDIKISDFGIAQILRSDTTQPVGLIGSPAYMSPEQIREEPLTQQTDFFSLGVLMYELLTGRSPFHADIFSSVVRKILYEEPLPIRYYRSDVPKTLETIVTKALSKRLSERYKTGVQFATDLSLTYINLKDSEEKIDQSERFNILRRLTFFRDFTESELWEVLRAMIWREYPPNSRIVTEGSIDETFFIIVHGQVSVIKGEKNVAILVEGDCFGEMGYLTKAKRTASILSLNDVTLLEMNNSAIEQASPNCQLRFHKVFLKTLLERLSEAGDKVRKSYP
ncbi:MAG TPA: serine/threonine-protein kinase [Dissulfurispiraceae bacterium]|nr:serine/threonine-protein kinase [Dissulfurispiraceae bacterium]